MENHKLGLIDTGAIMTMADVLGELERLDDQLAALELGQFKLFNAAYQVVTRSIQEAITDGYFKNPKFIEQFIVHFAAHYFDAVNDSVSGNPRLSPPWAKLNEYATNPSAPVFISLMLGANAHINNDLPQVLNKLLRNEKSADLLRDVLKIDKLLMKSGKEIIGLFEEKSSFLNFLKTRFQFTYYRPAMYTILYWRLGAWKNYRKLKKDESAMSVITKRSEKIANRMLRLAKVLG